MVTERPKAKEPCPPWQAVRGRDERLSTLNDWICPRCRVIIANNISGRNICQRCGAIVGSDPEPTGNAGRARFLAWHRFAKRIRYPADAAHAVELDFQDI